MKDFKEKKESVDKLMETLILGNELLVETESKESRLMVAECQQAGLRAIRIIIYDLLKTMNNLEEGD